MSEPCPNCGSYRTRAARRGTLYYSRHGPVVPPGCLSLILVAVGFALFVVGEWLLPAFRLGLFLFGAVVLLMPLVLPFHYLRYKRAYRYEWKCKTCGHRWRGQAS
ncbi:MAG TPA: hypothetical protein VH599_08380 [Ktedonobacterales bacterium]|jgi:hypothetical protein